MIVVNGCPKSGTHAVMALLDTMGLKRCPGTLLVIEEEVRVVGVSALTVAQLRLMPDNVFILAHVPSRWYLGLRMIFVKRDPRNVLLSYVRHRKRVDGLDVPIIYAMSDFWGSGFVSLYRSYLGWTESAVVVRYEDLPPDVIGDGAGIYSPGPDYNTRTGEPSRWQDVWSDEVEAHWRKHGGDELLIEARYV